MRLKQLMGGRFVLVLTIAGFLLTMGWSFANLRRYEQLGRVELSDMTWEVAQLRYEFLRFVSTLDLYTQPTSDVSRAELVERFDVLWSRVPLFYQGSEGARFAIVPGLQEAARELLAKLQALEPQVLALEKGDQAAHAALRDALMPKFEPLNALVMSALFRNEIRATNYNAELDRAHLLLMIGFAGALLSGAGLIASSVRDARLARQAQSRAQAASQQLRVALDSIPDGFALYDADDRLVLCNDQYIRFYQPAAAAIHPGARREAILWALAVSGALAAAPVEARAWVTARLQDRDEPGRGGGEQQLSDGRWLRVSEHRTVDGGTVGVLTDITELKQREAALRLAKEQADGANRAKTAFLATMSHELRTPLNAIIGFSELMTSELLGPIDNPNYAEYVRDIHTSGSHLLEVINSILDLAKVEAGRLEMVEEVFTLDEIIHSASKLAYRGDHGHDITYELDLPAPPLRIRGDSKLVRQILVNLYSNAFKFTPAGGRVRTEATRADDGSLVLRVIDTGIGIAADDLPRIMQPFVQLENHLRRRHDGTGLGLSLVKAMVELHGGTFALESQQGRGTTASVVLPPSRLLDGAAPAGTEVAATPARALGG